MPKQRVNMIIDKQKKNIYKEITTIFKPTATFQISRDYYKME